MRDRVVDHVEVLDKVKSLALLPDNVHITVDMAALYFEVDVEAVKKTIQRNRDELFDDGAQVLTGSDLARFREEFARDNLSPANLSSKTRSLTLLPRRAVLRLAMLLRDSAVAQSVRTYLLNVEERASVEVRSEAADKAALGEARMRVLRTAEGIVDGEWLALKARLVIAKALDEEPEVDPGDRPLYVPDFLRSKGLKGSEIDSAQSWFGRRAASLYEAEHGEKPGKRLEETTRGAARETYAWRERDRSVFEETWLRWYAAAHPAPPQQLGLMTT